MLLKQSTSIFTLAYELLLTTALWVIRYLTAIAFLATFLFVVTISREQTVVELSPTNHFSHQPTKIVYVAIGTNPPSVTSHE